MITVPDYRGVRAAVPDTYDPNRRSGSGGQRYFTDMEYVRGPQLDRLEDGAEGYDAAGQARYETRYNAAVDAALGGANTRAANQSTSLAASNLANPAKQGLPSLQRVTDSVLATDMEDILAGTTTTDRQKINQGIGYMNENAVSPYRLSEVTGTPLANIQEGMSAFYQTDAEKAQQSSPNAGIQAALNNVVAESQSRPYENFLRNIPVDGAYSTEEAGTVTDLLNKGHVTVQQIATYFNVPVEEVRQYYRAQGNRQGVGGASTITPDQLATFGTDINSATEAEVSSLVSLINSGGTTVEAVAARYNTTPAAVQAYLDSLVASTNGSIVTGTGLDDSNYGLSGGSGLSSTIVPGSRMSGGGLAALGGKGMYLGGSTDGMADNIPASINGSEPARLSDGEFVIPADVVSHLGNGNSDAGAHQLHGMMDRIRKARTGNTKQGREINPNNFLA
tara:strand:+ start:534 stop:1880 length:1347 start_codon:yes stop_codon:yes gene_type:complete